MGISTGKSGKGPRSDINITPLVNVVLVLLIIFLVAMPIRLLHIPVEVPRELTHIEVSSASPIVLVGKTDGTVELDDGTGAVRHVSRKSGPHHPPHCQRDQDRPRRVRRLRRRPGLRRGHLDHGHGQGHGPRRQRPRHKTDQGRAQDHRQVAAARLPRAAPRSGPLAVLYQRGGRRSSRRPSRSCQGDLAATRSAICCGLRASRRMSQMTAISLRPVVNRCVPSGLNSAV